MSTRRSFLQSVLFLPSLVAADAFAQDKSLPASTSTTFADFENGYGDWTMEGDAFGTAPATDALYPGKIRGFTGRGFACSLPVKKGNAATGKLISKTFTIEKPVITFRIGGGNFPGMACLNLVVDGKIVRTETGDGSAQLLEKSWGVAEFAGKTAHFEIVDATQDANRGYVMVDDIRFTESPPMRPQKMLEKYGIEPYFIQHTTFFRNEDERLNGRLIPVELAEQDFQSAINTVAVAIYCSQRLKPNPSRSTE